MRSSWDEAQPFVILVKWLGIGVMIYRWPELIRWAAERWNMENGYRDYLLALGWKFAAGLLVLELFSGQNLIGRLTA